MEQGSFDMTPFTEETLKIVLAPENCSSAKLEIKKYNLCYGSCKVVISRRLQVPAQKTSKNDMNIDDLSIYQSGRTVKLTDTILQY